MTELTPAPVTRLRDISRHVTGSTAFDTLGPVWELRTIVVAQGLQFTNELWEVNAVNWETNPYITVGSGRSEREPTAAERAERAAWYRGMKIPHSLQSEFPTMVTWGDKFALYFSERQGVIFYLQVVSTKTALKEAMETPGIHVIYYGHARYGRGPCFRPGSDDGPGEDWGPGTSTQTGIYRMGYPFLAVSMHEIHEHGYTAAPLVSTGTKPARNDCDPDLRSHVWELRERTLPEICRNPRNARESLYEVDAMRPRFGPGVTDTTPFWTYAAAEGGRREWHVVLRAGWESTPASPFDLGATDVRCKVFCHFGCSTFAHNYRVLRFMKNWQRTEDDRFAYWTTRPSPGPVTRFWIRSLFKYSSLNAFDNWHPSLRYAVRDTNRQLLNAGYNYRVI